MKSLEGLTSCKTFLFYSNFTQIRFDNGVYKKNKQNKVFICVKAEILKQFVLEQCKQVA